MGVLANCFLTCVAHAALAAMETIKKLHVRVMDKGATQSLFCFLFVFLSFAAFWWNSPNGP